MEKEGAPRGAEDDLAGCVTTRDGRTLPFDDWYWETFEEEPSRPNLRRRSAALEARIAAVDAEILARGGRPC